MENKKISSTADLPNKWRLFGEAYQSDITPYFSGLFRSKSLRYITLMRDINAMVILKR